MFSDGVLKLFHNGNITNRLKGIHKGKTICSFCFGSKKLYDFVHDNPHIEFHPSEYTNNPAIIALNRNMVAINSALEIDVTGQMAADSLGGMLYSGIGGQVDFIRGAGMSKGGRPIIALPSTAKGGTVSRIVPTLTQGSGVVTSRGDVHYVVTEYGIAPLRGRSLRERAMELIQVAHPKFREELQEQVVQSMKVPIHSIPKTLSIKELGEVDTIRLDLKDGKNYYLRPIRTSDLHRLQNFFYSHTKETLMQRYRHMPKSMSTDAAHRLVSIEQSRDIALCIVEFLGPRQVIRAVGRYYLKEDGESVETAFVVNESTRKLGMGTTLLGKLVEIAKARKIKRMEAMTRKDNHGMRKIAKKFGFKPTPYDDPDEILYTLKLSR